MDIITDPWTGAPLDDAAYLDLASALIADGRIGEVRGLLLAAGRHPGLWTSEAGEILLADMVSLLLDSLAAGDIVDAVAALTLFPADLAQQAIDLLLGVFLPEGEEDLSRLDDAALLCLAMLIGAIGRHDEGAALIDAALTVREDEHFAFAGLVIRDHLRRAAAPVEPFKAKLIIWDLDDTLWQGTLADGDAIRLHDHRADFIRALNQHGIVSAICSKNDFATARAELERLGLWDEFVFPRIAFLPKGEVVRRLIDDMQLRPANVLFIDDNVRNLEEVAAAVPGISVVDATSPDCDRLLGDVLADNAHVEKTRVADYRILEARVTERQQAPELTDEAFLLQSGIEASYIHRMDNLDFAGRIEELINRSNQLNYTASRVEPGAIAELILNVSEYDVFSAFVWDRYGYYGLVGVGIYDKRAHGLLHFALSCRVMHMGIEDFLIRAFHERYGRVDLGRLVKPLPAQGSAAITYRPFEDSAVRARILAEEAPRDWSKIKVRVMADCQSGAFHHYSRFRDEIDFDNIPRVFTLKMMVTGEWREQSFPDCLVYTPATDYMDWRWDGVMRLIDPTRYAEAAAQFCDMAVASGRKLLLFLPPEDAHLTYYDVVTTVTAVEMRERNRAFNALWRALAAQHPADIRIVDLGDFVGEEDLVLHAYHYVPSALQRMSAITDDWYAEMREA